MHFVGQGKSEYYCAFGSQGSSLCRIKIMRAAKGLLYMETDHPLKKAL